MKKEVYEAAQTFADCVQTQCTEKLMELNVEGKSLCFDIAFEYITRGVEAALSLSEYILDSENFDKAEAIGSVLYIGKCENTPVGEEFQKLALSKISVVCQIVESGDMEKLSKILNLYTYFTR